MKIELCKNRIFDRLQILLLINTYCIMKNYFENITTLEDAKKLFRELCVKLHPDTSGADTQSEFITMYQQFKSFKPKTGTDKQNQDFESFDASEFYDMIKNFDNLINIDISFVGSFIWLEDNEPGATFLQREKIKNIKLKGYNGARFAALKKTWYFSPEDYQQKSRSKKSLEQIKNSYGCKTFKSSKNLQLT